MPRRRDPLSDLGAFFVSPGAERQLAQAGWSLAYLRSQHERRLCPGTQPERPTRRISERYQLTPECAVLVHTDPAGRYTVTTVILPHEW